MKTILLKPLTVSVSVTISLISLSNDIIIYIWFYIFFLSLQTFYRQCLHDNAPPTTPSTTIAAVNVTHPTPAPADSNLQSAPIVRRDVNGSAAGSSPLSADGSSPLAVAEDVAESLSSTCELPLSYVSDNVLPALWRVIYWTSQVLTWLVFFFFFFSFWKQNVLFFSLFFLFSLYKCSFFFTVNIWHCTSCQKREREQVNEREREREEQSRLNAMLLSLEIKAKLEFANYPIHYPQAIFFLLSSTSDVMPVCFPHTSNAFTVLALVIPAVDRTWWICAVDGFLLLSLILTVCRMLLISKLLCFLQLYDIFLHCFCCLM